MDCEDRFFKLFSDDDRVRLKDGLKVKLKDEYDEEKANNFINNLEIHCYQMKSLMELPTHSQQSTDLKAIVKTFQKCIGHLDDLPHKHWHFWWVGQSRNFYDVDFRPDFNDEEKFKLVKDEKAENKKREALLTEAKSALSAITEIIEQEINKELKIGRPKADEKNFAYAIGKLLLFELSVRPTTTRTGLFPAVLNIAWNALGQEKEYPLNEVGNAVKKINTVFSP